MTPRTLLAMAWTVMVLALCLLPGSWLKLGGGGHSGPGLFGFLPIDKLVHLTFFAGFGLLWRRARLGPARTAIGGVTLALVTELGQLIPALERTADPFDLLQDAIGLALGIWLGGLLVGRDLGPPSPS